MAVDIRSTALERRPREMLVSVPKSMYRTQPASLLTGRHEMRFSQRIGWSLLFLMSGAAIAETPRGGAPVPKQKCRTVNIPVIVCPAGQTLATPGNTCRAELQKRTFCRDVARTGPISPGAPGVRELIVKN